MAEKPAAAAATTEAPTGETKNCAACGKPMKKAKRYYRNGKYYCNKNCFKGKGKAAAGAKTGAKES